MARALWKGIVEAKRRNREPELERQEMRADANVVDLMERLRRSLGQAGSLTRWRAGAATRRPRRYLQPGMRNAPIRVE